MTKLKNQLLKKHGSIFTPFILNGILFFSFTIQNHKWSFPPSLQYNFFNIILNCKDRIFKCKISESNKCNYCNQIDTLERHLIHCTISSRIWDSLTEWICNNLLINYHFTECELLFRIPFTNSIDLKLIIFVILFKKWFINQKKTSKAKLF